MSTSPNSAAPRVSIIIPSYNTAKLISACLDSVFAQSYTDFEAMVVNDGSPDTVELEKALQPYLPRIVYLKQENKRAAGARNNAIRHARGEFLAFLDSDDIWRPEHLALQMKLFADNPSLDFVYSNARCVGVPGHEWDFMDRCPSHGQPDFEGLVTERCQIPVSTVVLRRQKAIEVGGFDETLPRCDDYDMWVRCAYAGAKIAYNRTVQAHLLMGRPGSLSLSRSRMMEAYFNILEKYRSTLPLNDSDRQVVSRRAAEIRAICLLEEGKCKLADREFDKAKQLISEANGHLRRSSLSLTVLGLGIAPSTTRRLLSLWRWMRSGASV
ncbi:MAG TPA: glycosyltransferase family A protein [Candidatus Sulfotelmatobacter sp.]|nr:glycosyltransferase family A protein [Candidatus Sulfotelmatobacter sp.]